MMEGLYDIEDVRTFGLIVEAGGVSAASRAHGISKATLSRAVARLEDAAGAPLFDRVAKGLRLTPLGETLRPAAESAIGVARDAREALRAARGEPAGPLRIAADALTAQQLLAPVLAEFAAANPKVDTHVAVTAMGPDPISDEFDVVLRVGRPVEPHLVARRIIARPLEIFAPAAAAARTDLRDPAAVSSLGRIVMAVPGVPSEWRLRSGDGEIVLDDDPLVSVGDPLVAIGMLKAGVGVALVPDVFDSPLIDGSDIVRALPGWTAGDIEVFAVLPQGRSAIPAVRLFVDMLVAHAKLLSIAEKITPARDLPQFRTGTSADLSREAASTASAP